VKFTELESMRLRYRKFMPEDFPTVFDWLGNAENMKYRSGEPKSEAEARQYLEWAMSTVEEEECRNFKYAVVLKEDDSLIGACEIYNVPDDPMLMWELHRNYWQCGYGTEIGETLLRFGFNTLQVRRITADCNALNRGSYRVMERIGMRREAHFVKAKRGNSALGHAWCDRFQYAILREEWLVMKERK